MLLHSLECKSCFHSLTICILQISGTHKIKKTELQKEGFSLIEDPIYFLLQGSYVPLTEEIYNSIMSGKTRL